MSNIEVYSPAHHESPREISAGWRFILTYLVSFSVWETQQRKLRESQPLLLPPTSNPDSSASPTHSETTTQKTDTKNITRFNHSRSSTQQSEIKQFADSEDPLITVINFILREVQPLKNREEKLELLRYYLGSLLSESQQTPFSATGYEIVSENGSLTLHDDIYRLNPDLLSVCELSVTKAKNHLEKGRFTLEKRQIEHIIEKLKTLLETGVSPHSLTKELTTLTEPSPTLPTSWVKGTGQLTPKTAEKLGIPLNTPYFVEHKQLYFMPQSTVHKGGLSVAAMVQPLYVPALKRFYLIHNQYLYKASWKKHLAQLERLHVTVPPEIKTAKDTAVTEAFLMSQLISLPAYQAESAEQTFQHLFRLGSLTNIRQRWKEFQLKHMDTSLTRYSELLLDVFDHEQAKRAFNPQSLRDVIPFMKRVVLAGLFSHKKISATDKQKLFTFYTENHHLSEESFAKQLAKKLSFLPALRGFNYSSLECVSIGSVKALINPRSLLMKDWLGSINPNNLTYEDISHFVGKDRARHWKANQTCAKCGTTQVWVGECGWCLACELIAERTSLPISRTNLDQNRTKPALVTTSTRNQHNGVAESNEQSVSLTNFVANLV